MLPVTYQFVMRVGPTPEKVFPLSKEEITLGRDIVNDIVINDAELSRRHARLTLQAGGFVLEDLGSTNGTFVNGQRLMGPHALRSGELVMLGENIGLIFEALQFDPDATLVAGQGQPAYAAPVSVPAYTPPPAGKIPPPPASAYVGQVPAGPAEEPEPEEEEKKGLNPWLLAGCGCLVLAVIGIVVILFVIDALNLWCTLFGFLLSGCS